ncbi:sodium-dependent phosphate transport protein 4 isoform X3 [Prionailurus bengalensis]|uniref:sodium-dependent phosphate transport protein 4 isoform X3 n=1 Tax=Prionailurus bengalensis TaxID=37029 RepID=UPI001CA987CA|nr:sodium-dependent phosphate transport protein 4 isoform X3 [Prionailurus bengalensis]
MATMTELSPTAGKTKHSQDTRVDESLVPKKVLSFRSTRYGIAFITHFCNFILMAQYAAINISMVAMVNGTNHQSQFNGSTESLPLDALGGSDDAPNSLPAEGSIFGGQHALWERWGPPRERSRLCTLALSGMMLGTFTIILLGGIISQTLGWPFVFYIFGGIGCVYCLLWFVLVYDDPASHPWISVTEKEYIVSSLAQQVSPHKQPLPFKAMLRSLPLHAICLCSFSHQWLITILIVYMPTYISSVFNINIRDNGFLSAFPFIISWVTGILGGQLADFLLTKNFRLVTVRKIATFLGNFPSSVLLVALPYLTPDYVTTMTFLIVSCGLTPFCQSGIYINTLDIAPRHSSFLMGVSREFGYTATILAPTISGFLLSQDPEFGWRNVFLLLFAINLSGLIFYLIFGDAVVQDWAKDRKLTRL